MFYDFPYLQTGFSEEEWDAMESSEKRVVRDWYLNGGIREEALCYGFYDTVFQVRKIERKFALEQRPKIKLSIDDFMLCAA